MKNKFIYNFIGIITLSVALYSGCKSSQKTAVESGVAKGEGSLSERCLIERDPGPCRGAFTRYYYDRAKGKCQSFIYGGCEGVVPFETLEECQAACKCD